MLEADPKYMSSAVRERNKYIFEPVDKSAKASRQRSTEEADLQSEIIEHLQTLGYLAAHFRPRPNRGERTPARGNGEGFPDIIAVHPHSGRCLVLELKSEKIRVSGRAAPSGREHGCR